MEFSAKFGTFSAETSPRAEGGPFRIAILGDFSGRASRGEIGIGDDLASRRAIKFDIDTIEDVIEGFGTTLRLDLGQDGAAIDIELKSIDDLHPDELYEKLEIFEELSELDDRIDEMRDWGEEFGKPMKIAKRSAANSVPADRPLSAFEALVGAEREVAPATPADELIQRIVGPYAVKAEDDGGLSEIAEEAVSRTMRMILHHPDFQAIESQWRMLDMLARRIETDVDLQLFLFDVSAEELAADLAHQEELSESGFYKLMNEPKLPDGDGRFAAAFGLYTFEETPPHAELLGRIAQVASQVQTGFVTAISPGHFDVQLKDRHPLVTEAWEALRKLPHANYLGLVSPRFMLRLPYGAKSDPIYEFEFEEFTPQEGLSGLLWGNPAAVAAVLLAKTRKQGGKDMRLGDIMSLDDLPFHYVTDRHGDQVSLPCTERNVNEPKINSAVARGLMPLTAPRGVDAVRLASFQALSGEILSGAWSDNPPPPPTPAAPPPKPAPAPAPAAAPAVTPAPAKAPPVTPAPAKAPPPAAAPAPEPEPEEEAEAVLDSELDDLLGDLDLGGDDDDGGDDLDLSTGDDELDALLAGFGDDDDEDDSASADDLDAELAALLDDL